MIDHTYSTVLGSPRDQLVLGDIKRNPDTTTHQIAARLDLSYQVICGALRRLRDFGLVLTDGPQSNGNRGDKPGTYRLSEAAAKAMLPAGTVYRQRRSDPRAAFTRKVILDTVAKHGTLSRRELVAVSGVGLSTLTSYVPALIAEGRVTSEYRGGAVFYSPAGAQA